MITNHRSQDDTRGGDGGACLARCGGLLLEGVTNISASIYGLKA